MSTHKHIDAICIGITVFILLLTLLFMNGKALGIQAVASEEDSDAMFTENDLDDAWDTDGATRITLSDEGSTVQGNGAYVNDGVVSIVYAGKYVVSGELSDGSIRIEADGDDKIRLMLDGVSLHCEDGAAIRVEQAGKVFLTLREGTENTLSSGSVYSEEAVADGVDGTIYSRDDLTIGGGGSLTVTAEYQHGIVCNDDFVVTGGTLNVTAVQDAIHANDSARIREADMTLTAGDDGITVSNDEETAFLYVESGNIRIPSCCEGLEAVQITIAGGTLDIAASDDGLNANGYSGNSLITIAGGEISVTVEDGRDADGIDSNKDIDISGGKVFVSVSDSGGSCAIDYGSEYGGKCEISGGTVLACGSSGMAEGFDSTSTQGFLMKTTSAAAGTSVAVKDADGNELLSETVPCSFSSVLVSTPEMKVGDTCTLIVGDNETEMTIDNSSSAGAGGFGGFGGGKMRGGKGLDGGEMPGRGSFDANGGTLDGGAAGETQDGGSVPNGSGSVPNGSESIPNDGGIVFNESGSVPNDSEGSVASDVSVIRLSSTVGSAVSSGNVTDETASSDAQNGDMSPRFPGNGEAAGMQPPDGTEEGVTPPEKPDGAEEGAMPPDLPQDGTEGNAGASELPQNGSGGNISQNGTASDLPSDRPEGSAPDAFVGGENGGGTQSVIPRGDRTFGGRQNGGMMQDPNAAAQGQEQASQTAAVGTPISAETVLLVGISFVVLLVGCIIAYFYKRRM